MSKPHSHNKKIRKTNKSADNSLWIYGYHAAVAAINNPKREVLRVLATKNTANDLGKLTVEIVDQKEFERLLPADSVHQGIACEVMPLSDKALDEVTDAKVVIILDQVTDPHNVGAVLRSAAAFGASAIIMTKDHSPLESGTMAKAASGALEVVPLIRVTNLVAAIEQLKECGYWVLGLDGTEKKRLHEIQKFEKIALVLGAEGKGLRRLTREKCDLLASLPISANMESLNVSNAAAVALYEIVR